MLDQLLEPGIESPEEAGDVPQKECEGPAVELVVQSVLECTRRGGRRSSSEATL